MIPKSNVKLIAGDCCLVPRSDGTFVPFVFVASVKNTRSYFFGGLLDEILDQSSLETISRNRMIWKYARLHIKCFKENDTPIIGNVISLLKGGEIERIIRESNRTGIGAKSYVWGHRTIFKHANEL